MPPFSRPVVVACDVPPLLARKRKIRRKAAHALARASKVPLDDIVGSTRHREIVGDPSRAYEVAVALSDDEHGVVSRLKASAGPDRLLTLSSLDVHLNLASDSDELVEDDSQVRRTISLVNEAGVSFIDK